ncbi:MAG: hypothetical protein JXB36_21200 [Gammaproteobacteria bacterium]|nr:hypothetical protein [Gammaproteobacteria bacterium]
MDSSDALPPAGTRPLPVRPAHRPLAARASAAAARRLRIAWRRAKETQWAMRASRVRQRTAPGQNLLPYDARLPVVYVKDWPRNCYTDDYVMALASRGSISLAGIVTSSSVAPYNHFVGPEDYERFVAERAESIRLARRSGLRHIPDPLRGPKGHLERPASGRIEDTAPIASEGTLAIVEMARRAAPDEPLLLVVCTGLTAAADAFLVDPSIRDRVVVAWLGGHERDMCDYDGWSDGWAAYVALRRLRLVQFPPFRCDPSVPKQRLLQLPETPLRRWMLAKELPDDQGKSRDADAPPLVSIVRPDYVLETTRVSFGGWKRKAGHAVPTLAPDPHGAALVVTCADRRVATEAWWEAMTDPATWGRHSPSSTLT